MTGYMGAAITAIFVLLGALLSNYLALRAEQANRKYCQEKRDEYMKKYFETIDERNHYIRLYTKTQTELYFAKNKKSTSNNQDLIDAVKKGMMAAHPDRGGKQEDFVRFHKVYKELKGEH